MFKKYDKCVYAGAVCYIRRKRNDQVVIMTTDGIWAEKQSGWVQVDKFEWEKTVPLTDVEYVEEA